MGRSTTDPKTLSSSARCHFNLARVFPFPSDSLFFQIFFFFFGRSIGADYVLLQLTKRPCLCTMQSLVSEPAQFVETRLVSADDGLCGEESAVVGGAEPKVGIGQLLVRERSVIENQL